MCDLIIFIGKTIAISILNVIGGIIPLALLIWIVFVNTRKKARMRIPEIERYIKTKKSILQNRREFLEKTGGEIWNAHMQGYETEKLLEQIAINQNKIMELDKEISNKEAWIRKIKSYTFWDWVNDYIHKSYISDSLDT